ncbi:MAG: tRNA dihydrouridine(20/20a) synthase DusA [Candidatus Competibacterales bacterium]
MTSSFPHPFAVAPMMDWTDRHDRYFLRLISRRATLYTEMVTTGAVLHGHRERLLGFDPFEHPVAVQLGGSDPGELAQAARIAVDFGYDEVNLNVGCPSDRVQSGRFGACLMAEPDLVARCVAAMQDAVGDRVPVTVKSRIGIDQQDDYRDLQRFVATVAATGCNRFIVHARKAWLQGLSPKENREVPPLRYEVVHRLKAEFPPLTVVINGGLQTLDQGLQQLKKVDGVMVGRAAYQTPYLLAEVDRRFYKDPTPPRSRREVVEALLPYLEAQRARGVRLQTMVRHILGLYQGEPGAKLWRRHLSQHAHRPNAGIEVVQVALAQVEAVRTRALAKSAVTPAP